jgi:hypothetical protein
LKSVSQRQALGQAFDKEDDEPGQDDQYRASDQCHRDLVLDRATHLPIICLQITPDYVGWLGCFSEPPVSVTASLNACASEEDVGH